MKVSHGYFGVMKDKFGLFQSYVEYFGVISRLLWIYLASFQSYEGYIRIFQYNEEYFMVIKAFD